MKLNADLTLVLTRAIGGAAPTFSFSKYCLAAAALVTAPDVLAACVDNARATAGQGDACVAVRSSYGGLNISASPIISNDTGAPAITSLTFTAPDVTITSGGSAARAIRADGGNITFEGNATVYRSPNGHGATSNGGFGLEAHGRDPARGAVVVFEKDATFLVDVSNGDGMQVGSGAKASFKGLTEITAGRFGAYSRTITAVSPPYPEGSSLIEFNNLRIRSVDEALKVNGAFNNAIVVTGSIVDIATSGAAGRGIQAEDGGKVFVRASGGAGSADGNSLIVMDTATATVSTVGNRSHGLHAVSNKGDATIVLGGGTVTTASDDAEGIYAYVNGGTGNAYVTMSGGSVITAGEDAEGVLAVVNDDSDFFSINGNASAVMTGGSISVGGDASAGLLAQTDFGLLPSQGWASVTQTAGTIQTRGDTLAGTNVLGIPQGSYSLAALSLGSGDAEVLQAGGSARTEGNGAHAIYTFARSGDNTVIQGAGASAIATGVDSSGLRALAFLGGANTLTFNGSLTGGTGRAAALHSLSSSNSIITVGATAKIDGSASGVAIRDGDSDLTGVDDYGGDAQIRIDGHVIGYVIMGLGDDTLLLSGGILEGDIYGDDQVESANDGNDSFTWTGGTWLSSFYGGGGSDTVEVSAGSYDGSHHVLDGGDDTSSADGFIDRLTFRNISADAYGANLRNWEVITLDQAAITITDGSLLVGADADTGMFLRNASVLHGDASLVLNGHLTIDASSAFESVGAGSGLYAVTGSLTQAGRLSLSDGVAGDRFSAQSNYQVNGGLVVLDTQLGADNSATDRLILMGDSQGTALLQVNNAAGLGAQTVEGIKVVEVQGNSTVQFTLKDDYFFEGQPSVVGGAYAYRLYQDGANATGDEGWYLRSVLMDQGEPGPHYHPGVPLYESYSQHLLALSTLPSLQQRTAGRTFNPLAVARLNGNSVLAESDSLELWGRVEGNHSVYKPVKTSSGTDFDLDVWRAQGGLDHLLYKADQGSLLGAVTAHYTKANSDVSAVHGRGQLSTSGLGVGAALTWYAANDFYADLQAQVTWLKTELDSKTAQRKLAKDNHSQAYNLSLEIGRQFQITEQLAWVPQAQLMYTSINTDNFTDPFAVRISNRRAESTRARLGASLDHYWQWEAKQAHLYGIANVYHEFSQPDAVKVAATSFRSEVEPNWAEIGLGASVQWDDKYQLYTELSYGAGLKHAGSNHSGQGTLGLKVLW